MELLKFALLAALVLGLSMSMPTRESGEPEPVAMTNETTSQLGSETLSTGPCNEADEIVSNDPCKPLCACRNEKIVCADVQCTTDSLPLDTCWKLPLNGKCCPSYLCSTGNATGDVHYPLPVLVIPPELNLASIPPSKAELLHRVRRPGA